MCDDDDIEGRGYRTDWPGRSSQRLTVMEAAFYIFGVTMVVLGGFILVGIIILLASL